MTPHESRQQDAQHIAIAGVIAAVYAVLTIGLAPLSYGPLQFRVSGVLKPAAMFSPVMAMAFAVGTLLANLFSPFGFWDWGCMPIVDALAALVCWKLRRFGFASVLLQAVIVSAGVAVFPLGRGARMPILLGFAYVIGPQIITAAIGWFLIWKPRGREVFR